MPRKTPLPEREREICRRFRQFREEFLLLSRVKFARAIEADSATISNYDYKRSPVRYGIAERVGKRFDINPTWLATGTGEMCHWFTGPEPILLTTTHSSDLFSKVYDTQIAPALTRFESQLKSGFDFVDQFIMLDRLSNSGLPSNPETYAAEVFDSLRNLSNLLTKPAAKALFLQFVARSALKYFENEEKFRNLHLTDTSRCESIDVMRSLQSLLKEARRLAEPRGKKLEMAKALGVTPETVSRYLSLSGIEPGGETTLKLLSWVEREKGGTKQ